MLSQFGKTLRSFVIGDSNPAQKANRKRQRDDTDDLDDVTITHTKRIKISEGDKGVSNTWALGKFAEWMVRKPRSFAESFYVKEFTRRASPRKLLDRLKSYRNKNNSNNSNLQVPVVSQAVTMDPARTWVPPTTTHHSACPTAPHVGPGPVPVPPPVRPGPGQTSPASPKTGYVDLPYPFVFPPDVIWTSKEGQFKVPSGKPPMPPMDLRNVRQPMVRPPSAMGNPMPNMTMSYNGLPRPATPIAVSRSSSFTSVYDRVYHNHHPHHQYPSHSLPNTSGGTSSQPRGRLAAKESFRIEEKNRYAQLLQQFTTVPLNGTSNGVSHAQPSKKTSLTSSDKTPLGMTIPAPQLKRRELSAVRQGSGDHLVQEVTPHPVSTSTPQPRQHHLAHSSPVIDLTQEVEPHLMHSSTQSSRHSSIHSHSRPVRIPTHPTERLSRDTDLVTPVRTKDATTTKNQPPTALSFDDSPVVVLDSPKTPRSPVVEEFERSMRECRYTEDWLKDVTSKYSEDNRKREQRIKQQEVELEVFKEKRDQWESQLEQRIRTKLRLAEREPAIETYQYIESEESESEEEQQEDEFPELDDEQEQVVNNSLRPQPAGEVLSEGFRLQICRSDMETLRGLNWLNDEIVNFYFELIRERGKQDNFPTVHVFNTFFYPKVKNQGHQGVRRWTKQVDIFSVDYIAIPIHLGMHWCLAVIDFGRKAIRYFDSMGGKNNECLNVLKNYLVAEHKAKKGSPCDMSEWELENVTGIPQQMNGSDCGVFTCKYADYVTQSKDITFDQSHMPYFRRRMVFEIVSKQLLS